MLVTTTLLTLFLSSPGPITFCWDEPACDDPDDICVHLKVDVDGDDENDREAEFCTGACEDDLDCLGLGAGAVCDVSGDYGTVCVLPCQVDADCPQFGYCDVYGDLICIW